MKDAGRAHMGVGVATGKEKAEQAAMAAVSSPLLETSINGATGVLVNVTGSTELTLDDVETAANLVAEAVNPDANIIFGATTTDDMKDEMRVTVIATGFDPRPAAPKEEEEDISVAPVTEAQGEAAPKARSVSDIDAFLDLFNR